MKSTVYYDNYCYIERLIGIFNPALKNDAQILFPLLLDLNLS